MKLFWTLILGVFLLISCTEQGTKNDNIAGNDEIATKKSENDIKDLNDSLNDEQTKGEIQLIAIDRVPQIAGAGIKTISPINDASLPKGSVTFNYEIENFNLSIPTAEKTDFNLVESDKGQHIHAILNNEPYMAHYKPSFSKELIEGQYILLSFLSRSYHLSDKSRAAFDLIQFTVGEPKESKYDLTKPYLFYSRPKGSYNVSQNSDILLDFYLVNCDLKENGFRIKLKVAGSDFLLTEWKPYAIRGLSEGIHTISMELIDGSGNRVDSPFNPMSRNISIQQE